MYDRIILDPRNEFSRRMACMACTGTETGNSRQFHRSRLDIPRSEQRQKAAACTSHRKKKSLPTIEIDTGFRLSRLYCQKYPPEGQGEGITFARLTRVPFCIVTGASLLDRHNHHFLLKPDHHAGGPSLRVPLRRDDSTAGLVGCTVASSYQTTSIGWSRSVGGRPSEGCDMSDLS